MSDAVLRPEVHPAWPSPPGGWTPRLWRLIRGVCYDTPPLLQSPYGGWQGVVGSASHGRLNRRDWDRVSSVFPAEIRKYTGRYINEAVAVTQLTGYIAIRCRRSARPARTGTEIMATLWPEPHEAGDVTWGAYGSIRRYVARWMEAMPAMATWLTSILKLWEGGGVSPDRDCHHPDHWGWLESLHYGQLAITLERSPTQVRDDLIKMHILGEGVRAPYFQSLTYSGRQFQQHSRTMTKIKVLERSGEWWLAREWIRSMRYLTRSWQAYGEPSDDLTANWLVWNPGMKIGHRPDGAGVVWMVGSSVTSVAGALASLTSSRIASQICEGRWVWPMEHYWLVEMNTPGWDTEEWIASMKLDAVFGIDKLMAIPFWCPGESSIKWTTPERDVSIPVSSTVQGIRAIAVKSPKKLQSWPPTGA